MDTETILIVPKAVHERLAIDVLGYKPTKSIVADTPRRLRGLGMKGQKLIICNYSWFSNEAWEEIQIIKRRFSEVEYINT